MRLAPIFIWFALVVAAGCGLGTASSRCELRPAKNQCTDVRNALPTTAAGLRAVCGMLTFAYPDAGGFTDAKTCDTTGSVGGCEALQGDGAKQTNWFFPPSTADSVRSDCGNSSKFVTPQ